MRNLTNTSGVHDKWPAWSPDGSRIAFISDKSGEEEIWVVPQSGSGAAEQITSGDKAFLSRPKWSPDGKSIALALTPEVSLLAKPKFIKHVSTSPAGKTEIQTPDVYSWSVATSVVLRSGSTILLAILDPVEKEQYIGTENVVLILLTATVQPEE